MKKDIKVSYDQVDINNDVSQVIGEQSTATIKISGIDKKFIKQISDGEVKSITFDVDETTVNHASYVMGFK